MQTLSRVLINALLILLLAACGDRPAAAPTGVAAPADPPADPQLARLYEQTCKTCHGSGAGGAPVTGDTAAWMARAAQGVPTLLDHTLNGYRGMPPLGLCSDCTAEEFEALIRYMAGISGDRP